MSHPRYRKIEPTKPQFNKLPPDLRDPVPIRLNRNPLYCKKCGSGAISTILDQNWVYHFCCDRCSSDDLPAILTPRKTPAERPLVLCSDPHEWHEAGLSSVGPFFRTYQQNGIWVRGESG